MVTFGLNTKCHKPKVFRLRVDEFIKWKSRGSVRPEGNVNVCTKPQIPPILSALPVWTEAVDGPTAERPSSQVENMTAEWSDKFLSCFFFCRDSIWFQCDIFTDFRVCTNFPRGSFQVYWQHVFNPTKNDFHWRVALRASCLTSGYLVVQER